MCLILIAAGAHPEYPLIIAANRDEFYARPSAPAHWWQQGFLAGKDNKEGGTWLGITRAGRFAALTNYRDLRVTIPNAPTRGTLVTGCLQSRLNPAEWLQGIKPAAEYNGFNLLFGNISQLQVFSNVTGIVQPIPRGVHALSNAFLNTPWFKSVQTRLQLQNLLSTGFSVNGVFAILANATQAPDDELPDTGLPFALEKQISSAFIAGNEYGTRCSTIITVAASGVVTFLERSFTPQGVAERTVDFTFTLEKE